MTLSVKSSWSWTLKETSRREERGKERGSEREGERKDIRLVLDCSEVENEEVVMVEVDAGRQRISLADSVQILRTSSLWAICEEVRQEVFNNNVFIT